MNFKIKFIIIFLAAIVITITGCKNNENEIIVGPDPYAGKRPFDYGVAKWVSRDPEIWFKIDENDREMFNEYFDGFIEINNEFVGIEVFFDKWDGFYISEKSNSIDAPFTRGTCKFSPEKLEVTIDKEADNCEIIKGKFDKITFIKEPLE